jgi:hypothetical protein
MRERPIPFSAPMVRAILANQKTQTRRVVKPVGHDDSFVMLDHGAGWWPYRSDDGESSIRSDGTEVPHACPYGAPGDRLWVREAWTTHKFMDAIPPRDLQTISIAYVADGPIKTGKYRQAFHMPRRYSRITLEVTGVRVERLQDISEADAIAEGVQRLPLQDGPDAWWTGWMEKGPPLHGRTPQAAYRRLWESINGPGSWDANPWVWCVAFRRVAP